MSRKAFDEWFVAEVLACEPALSRYLSKNWRNQSDITGMSQEILARAYASALEKPPERAKPFVFAIARNLLIDRARRNKVISITFGDDTGHLEHPSHDPSAEEVVSARQEFEFLNDVVDQLPARCKEVFRLRKIEGLSQKDVATEMGISERTVENQLAKGVRFVADALYGPAGVFAGAGHDAMRGTRYLKGVSDDT